MTSSSAVRTAYPHLRHSHLALVLLIAVLASLTAACAGDSPESEPLNNGTVGPAVMEDLLTLEDIEAAGGDTARLRMEVEDVLAVASEMGTEQDRQATSWHATKVKRGNSNSVLIFTIMEFPSAEEAQVRLAQMEASLGFESMATPVGDSSAMLSANSGNGVTFAKAHRFVSLHSTASGGVPPILDSQGLERLARIIAGRL
ncbi:MAG: hypothetical protein WD645_00765 [Dehalococcoidia bacterium]